MAERKRSADEILKDRATIAHHYLRGMTQQAIADLINEARVPEKAITRQMISYDLGEMRKDWAESAKTDVEIQRAEALQKIDNLEATYWHAWEKSLQKQISTLAVTDTSSSSELKAQIKAGKVKSSVRTVARDGNPAYLAGIERCIAMRNKLLGANMPELIAATTPDGKQAPTLALPGGGLGFAVRWLTESEAEAQARDLQEQKARERLLLTGEEMTVQEGRVSGQAIQTDDASTPERG